MEYINPLSISEFPSLMTETGRRCNIKAIMMADLISMKEHFVISIVMFAVTFIMLVFSAAMFVLGVAPKACMIVMLVLGAAPNADMVTMQALGVTPNTNMVNMRVMGVAPNACMMFMRVLGVAPITFGVAPNSISSINITDSDTIPGKQASDLT